jgi:hypothetical protein
MGHVIIKNDHHSLLGNLGVGIDGITQLHEEINDCFPTGTSGQCEYRLQEPYTDGSQHCNTLTPLLIQVHFDWVCP